MARRPRRRTGWTRLRGVRGTGHARLGVRPARPRRRRRAGDALQSPARHGARSARRRAVGVVRDRDRGDLSRGGGGRPGRRRPLGARPPARRRLDGGGRHPERPAPAGSARRGTAGGADRRPRRRAPLGRGDRPGSRRLAAAAATSPLAKLVATRAAVNATDEALRIAGGPGFLAGRLERAFRDARAGLINPPLEDVALTGFARSVLDRVASGRERGRPNAAVRYAVARGVPLRPGPHDRPRQPRLHRDVRGRRRSASRPAKRSLGLPPKAFELMDLVLDGQARARARIDNDCRPAPARRRPAAGPRDGRDLRRHQPPQARQAGGVAWAPARIGGVDSSR